MRGSHDSTVELSRVGRCELNRRQSGRSAVIEAVCSRISVIIIIIIVDIFKVA